MSNPNAIRLDSVSKSFDGFKALSEASFTARWGEVHALLGENGAGKSSLMNIAAGLYAPETGSLFIDDNPVRLKGPLDAAAQGIGMVHQHFKLVKPFTVAENILLGLRHLQAGTYRQRLAQTAEQITAMAASLGFSIEPHARVDQLSVAEQQRVEILKVLLAGARILILDEPTAVLTDAEAENLLTTVQNFAHQEGAAVILVTHKMNDVMRYADQVTVMRTGSTVASLKPQTVSVGELVKLTVGDAPTPPQIPSSRDAGEVRLAVRDLRSSGDAPALRGVNLELRAGEIYGIAGVGGNGQSELAGALMGLPEPVFGEMELVGEGDLNSLSAARRRELGIACIPADRYSSALAAPLSISDNFAMGDVHSGRYGPFWFLRRKRIEVDTAAAVAEFDVQGVRSLQQKAALLSGGNAQKLVIAREFARTPQLVIVHSPSRGLDVRATLAVHERLRSARDAGAAVLLISEDLDEVMALADRIGVMSAGRIIGEFAQPADRQAIGQAMVNHV
ncbi:ABC transporter ATP-binding protein [Halopseudomonas sp.]|uniref:ABC transporter ATP-binding protein n=1 Tax=Halopseudomonas sp. TaxID=2901191 RepID=UPI0030033A65